MWSQKGKWLICLGLGPQFHPWTCSPQPPWWPESQWKRLWCWEGLGAGGKGDNRGWDGWMASPTQWTWVWVNSGSWWWTGRPGVLRFMGSQRVGHDWATELNWTVLEYLSSPFSLSAPHELCCSLSQWESVYPGKDGMITMIPLVEKPVSVSTITHLAWE